LQFKYSENPLQRLDIQGEVTFILVIAKKKLTSGWLLDPKPFGSVAEKVETKHLPSSLDKALNNNLSLLGSFEQATN